MAASDNPEVGTACLFIDTLEKSLKYLWFIQQIMEVMIGYRIFNVGD